MHNNVLRKVVEGTLLFIALFTSILSLEPVDTCWIYITTSEQFCDYYI